MEPNEEIRLVSNLMALNDPVEKDPYEMVYIQAIIRATSDSKWISVLDLKRVDTL